jgi:DNA polymerase-3 subunit gamma/tau
LSSIAPSTASEGDVAVEAPTASRGRAKKTEDAPVEVSAETPAAADATGPTVSSRSAANVTLADVRTMWPAVLEAVKSRGRVLWMRFSDATPVSLEDGVLAVGIPDAGRWKNIKGTPAEVELGEIVSSVMDAPVTIDAVLGSAPAGNHLAASASADAPSPDDADAHESDMTGESLAIAELGATVIGEITEG